jgi:phage baseplate assembly protein W
MIGYTNVEEDLVIIDGTFDKSEDTQQCIQDILSSSPGDYKQYPMIGADLKSYINSSSSTSMLERQIRLSLAMDEILLKGIGWVNGEIEIIVDDE